MNSVYLLHRRMKHLISLLTNGSQPSVSSYLGEVAVGATSRPVVDSVKKAGNEWDEYRVTITDEFRRHPMTFLRQPVISRTVHPNQQELAKAYLTEMGKDAFARRHILSRLNDVPIGDPFLCESFPFASPMSAQHAWYLLLMHRHLDLFVPTAALSNIVEFGGGYGNFCRLARSFGYSGRYTIADLPEMHAIQRHFLSHALPDRLMDQKTEFLSIEDPGILPVQSPSLFMATFSLSETPLALRMEVESLYEHFDYLFIAYNRSFGGVDNLEYFDGLRARLSSRLSFKLIRDEYRSAWFIFGQRL